MKSSIYLKPLLLFFFIFISHIGFSQRFWVSGVAGVWSGNNWSATSGGAPDGAGAPVAGTNAIFDANGTGNCTVDMAANFDGINTTGYIGIIDLNGQTFNIDGSNNNIFASGTINDIPGTSSVTISTTGLTTFSGATFGASISGASGGVLFNGSTFNAEVSIDKTGATNNTSLGGNVFNDNLTFTNSSTNQTILCGTNPDIYNSNVTLNHSGSYRFYFGNNASGITVAGNLIINSTVTGGTTIFYLASAAVSSLNVAGNVIINLAGSSTSQLLYLGNSGDLTIGGNLDINNTGSGNSSQVIMANNIDSEVTITGSSSILNNATSATTSYIYFGNQGDVTCNGEVNLINSSASTNSSIFIGNNLNSLITFNDNVTVQVTNTSNDGFYFGNNNGNVVLAAAKTISIPGSDPLNYIGGSLVFRNFTYAGNLPTEFELGATAQHFQSINSDWGGDATFKAPRIISNGTTYRGITLLEKTGGTSNDGSAGGNTFMSNVSLVNSGSQYFLMGNGSPDIFQGDVTMNNTGSHNLYIAHNSMGNTIAGDLIVSNTGNNPAGNTQVYISTSTTSDLVIAGDVNVVTNGTSSNTDYVYLGVGGDVTIAGNVTMDNSTGTNSQVRIADGTTSHVDITGNLSIDLTASGGNGQYAYAPYNGSLDLGGNLSIQNNSTATTSQIYIADRVGSAVTIDGTATILNNGTNTYSRIYLGNSGSITFNSTLDMTNSSDATNSQIYLNHSATSANQYNDDVTIKSTNVLSDGFLFGNGNGSGVLAANKTVYIPGVDIANFVGGYLYFRNFTQTGATDHSFELAPTAGYFQSITSNWGGNTDFRAPQFITNGSNYSGTAYLEKTGGLTNDQSAGGNSFTGDVIIKNSGSRYFMMGNGSGDVFGGNVDLLNTGTSTTYLAYSGAGHTIAGYLNVVNSATGTGNRSISITGLASSTLTINGDVTILNDGSGSQLYSYIGNLGTTDILGNVNIDNSGNGDRSDIRIANSNGAIVNITGNLDLITNNSLATINLSYVGNSGNVNIGGTMDITNNSNGTNSQVLVANSSSSSVIINGNSNIINGLGGTTTKRISLGYNGNITFNGTLNIENLSSANDSYIYANYGATSVNLYNEDVLVKSLDALGDGISFGQNGGSGTLAAGKSISIPGVDVTNFIGGSLYFRNFTQIGPTDHSFELGPTALYVYNRDCNWGGNVDFRAPRMYTNATTYNGTAHLEKTGGVGSDSSPAGNVFIGDVSLANSGSAYFMLGNGGTFDDFQGNLLMNNTGTHSMYVAYNSLGNQIAGNLTTINSATGSSCTINIASITTSSLVINGDVNMSSDGSATNLYSYLGDSGDITIGGNVTTNNAGTGNNSDLRIANNTNSLVSISGFVSSTNSPTAVNTQNTYVGNIGDVNIGGDLDLINTSISTNGNMYVGSNANSQIQIDGTTSALISGSGSNRYIYLGNNGQITFNGTVELINSSDATNAAIHCNSGAAAVNVFNENITVTTTDINCDGIYFGNSGGSATLAATKTITIPGVDPANFIGGRLTFRNFTQIGPTDHAFELGPGASYIYNYNSNWGGNIDFRAPRIYLRTTIFNQNAYIEKTGAGNDNLPGGCTYLGNAEFKLSNMVNTGYLYLAVNFPSNVSGDLSLRNTGSFGNLLFGSAAGAYTIGGDISMEQVTAGTQTQHTYFGNNTASTYSIGGDVNLLNNASNTSGNQYIYFLNNGSATVAGNINSVNSGLGGKNKYIYIGNAGSIDISGTLDIDQTTTAIAGQTFIARGAASTVSIDGAVNMNSSSIGTTTTRVYVGEYGDVIFNSTLNMVNASDATNSQYYLNYRTGSDNQYKDDVTLSSLNTSSDGFQFGTANGTGILAAGKTITIPGVDPLNFIGGDIQFRNFTQVGPTAHGFELASTANYIYNYNSNWGGDIDFRAPRIYTRESIYNGTSNMLKMGGSDDLSPGNNLFVGNVELSNSSSGNYFGMGQTNPDICQADLTLNNTGGGRIFYAWNSVGNQIGGDLFVNNLGNGVNSHIYVGYSGAAVSVNIDGNVTAINNGTATTNNTLIIGNNGTIDIGGNLIANNIGTGNLGNLYVGNVADVTVGGVSTFLNSATQSGQIYVAQNTSSEVIFTGDVSISNSGGVTTKRCYFGDYGDVTYNGNLEIVNSSGATNSEMYFNYRSVSVGTYNENITIENTNALGDGVFFGSANGNGTLANGKTISLSAGGFVAGQFYLRNFNQIGTTPQSIITTGTSRLTNYTSIWNGSVDFRAPRHYTNYTNYNADAYLEKTDTGNDASTGGNTYNGSTSIVNSGTGYFMPANGTSDDFNGDVSFIQSSTGLIYPNYNCISTYAGDINIDYTSGQIYFGAAGNGRALLDGSFDQDINDLGTSTLPLFRDFQVNKSGGVVNINTPIEITLVLDLDQGVVNTSAAGLMTMRDNSTVSSVSNVSHIDGPIEKIGNDAFVFPVGDLGFYRPISISNPASGSSRFRAEYFLSDPHNSGYLDGSRAPGVDYLSDCEFWTLDRNAANSNVTVTLSYDNQAGTCSGINDPTTVQIARWDGTLWQNHGNGAMTGSPTIGTISSAGTVTSFSPFTFHTSDENVNPLPISLIDFTANLNESNQVDLNWSTASEINNDYFAIERSTDGIDFNEIITQQGAGNSNTVISYSDIDKMPLNGISYYRLKQVDFDGQYTYSSIQTINMSVDNNVTIFPNPINVSQGDYTLNITQDNWNESTFSIIDQLGNIVFTESNLSKGINSIDVSSLSAGMYFVTIRNGESIENLRFIIQ